MIVVVTPNPALDLTWHVPAYTPGESHRADAARVRAGGKGLNVARVAHAQGAAVHAVTTSGGATGAEFAAELSRSGVPHTLVPVRAETRRSIAVVDDAGVATVVNERGTAPDPEELRRLRDAVAATTPSVLVVSGSVAPGTPDELIPELLARARERGAVTIADTSGPALWAAAEAGADVLKPNREELEAATGTVDPLSGARALLARGAGLVLVSCGADGMLAIRREDALRALPPERLRGNPTGAGDAAVAAVAVALAARPDLLRHDPGALLRTAVAWSAAAVLRPVAGDISPRHTEFAAAVRVTPVEETP